MRWWLLVIQINFDNKNVPYEYFGVICSDVFTYFCSILAFDRVQEYWRVQQWSTKWTLLLPSIQLSWLFSQTWERSSSSWCDARQPTTNETHTEHWSAHSFRCLIRLSFTQFILSLRQHFKRSKLRVIFELSYGLCIRSTRLRWRCISKVIFRFYWDMPVISFSLFLLSHQTKNRSHTGNNFKFILTSSLSLLWKSRISRFTFKVISPTHTISNNRE